MTISSKLCWTSASEFRLPDVTAVRAAEPVASSDIVDCSAETMLDVLDSMLMKAAALVAELGAVACCSC